MRKRDTTWLRILPPIAIAFSILTVVCSNSFAAQEFVRVNIPSAVNNRFEFSFVATWDFEQQVEVITPMFPAGLAWDVGLRSFPNADGTKDLFMGVNHRLPPLGPIHQGEGPNVGLLVIVEGNQRPPLPPGGRLRRAAAQQFDHQGAGHIHFDILRLRTELPPLVQGTGIVGGGGLHSRGRLAEWSYLGITGQVKVRRIDANGQEVADPIHTNLNAQAGEHRRPRNNAERLRPTDKGYTLVAAIGGANLPDPLTTTTLGFLGGVNGSPGMLDFGGATELFVGTEEFFAPVLSEPGGRDLFVGIDLTQWLSFPVSMSLLDEFDFVSGMNEMLPGIIVGTSPVQFDPNSGEFVTDNPAAGRFQIAAFIDGRVAVPGPWTVGSLAVGLFGLALMGRRRRAAPLR